MSVTKLKNIFVFAVLFLLSTSLKSQVLTVEPVFPKETDTVTIIYDATLGNAALKGVGQVYAHAGVITNLSTSSADWKHVVGTWGTADAKVKMTALGNNRWKMRYHLKNFYAQAGAFQANEVIQQMAFVFRNQDGSLVGRTAAGGDIFTPVYSASSSLMLKITLPESKTTIGKGTDLFKVVTWTSKNANIDCYLDGSLVRGVVSKDSLQEIFSNFSPGSHTIKMLAKAGMEVAADSVYFVVNPAVVQQTMPAGLEQGINYVNDSTVYLVLYAPYKNFVYAIGDFSNWQPDLKYFMKYDPSKACFWTKIEGLKPGFEVGYQYLVDGTKRIADPFSPLMLNEWDDAYIPSAVYPNLKAYPKNKTSGWVTVMQPGEQAFSWSKVNFQRPSKEKLVIYECLVRDFTKAQSFKALQDTLPYLKRLGITALQLMPVTEFEGNLSWGYNPASHMALDKYYGNRNAFKSLVNACHEQGIAVIMDVVFNHAFSTAPICQLYWDDTAFAPTANSPYANIVAKHPFNVGYDLNHESSAMRYYTKRILKYLLEEYKVDGFRFDLSKGFTQKNSGSDAGAMSAYDASRIAIWTDYYNAVQSYSPGAYHILEHFADNSEEVELSKKGMMLWGNAVYNMTEAAMGFSANSDFGWGIDYTKRGFEPNGLVGYASSHDEERMAYQLINYGNSASGYSTRSNPIFLERMAMLYSYLWLTPGPKMIWQFDELGYDYSINHCVNGTVNNACRLDNKPVRWDYWTGNANRKKLYYNNAMLLHLKNTYTDVNKPNSFNLSANNKYKRLQLNGAGFSTLVYGSTDVAPQTVYPGFPFKGTWYDYLSGDSIVVSDVNMSIGYKAGEYHVWTSKRVANPFLSKSTSSVLNIEELDLMVYPNPTDGKMTIRWNAPFEKGYLEIYDITGKMIKNVNISNGTMFDFEGQKPGVYVYKIRIGTVSSNGKIVLR